MTTLPSPSFPLILAAAVTVWLLPGLAWIGGAWVAEKRRTRRTGGAR